jgi:hypothetical protein
MKTPKQETRELALIDGGVPPTLASLDWQGRETVITSRGREKTVVVGIPGEAFWGAWSNRRDQVLADMRASNATLKRLGKGCWQVMVWENKHNKPLVNLICMEIGQPF